MVHRVPPRVRLAILGALVLAALAGFTGVAQSAIGEAGLARQQERSERRAALQAERSAARQAQREARERARAQQEEERQLRKTRQVGGGEVIVTSICTSSTIEFKGFPETGTRTIHGRITIQRNHGTEVLHVPLHLSFSGSAATYTVELPVFLGKYIVDVLAFWKGGHFDVGALVTCGPTPRFSIEKLERLGEAGEYVKGPLTGHVGEVVGYGIIVRNTGNEPLTLSALSDPKCDPGTITGGESPLPAGATTKYTCTHRLTEADLAAGSYSNVAAITATPPEGIGGPMEEGSETVVVNLAATPPEQHPPGPPPTTTNTGNGVAGTQFSSGIGNAAAPKTGVLTFVQTTPPSLRGPQGCVRSALKATLKAKGVASVVFYLDGHRVRAVTARSARRGLITISIDTSRLHVGAHRLLAKILMAKAASTGRHARTSRALLFVRCASAAVRPKFTG